MQRPSALTLMTLLLAFSLLLPTAADAADETKLLRQPDLSADQVVFVYAGDLWVAGADGGEARRLTTHEGAESFPKFSPDGKWIAFTGEYDGNVDVYVIPAEGGEPRRLTYHPNRDLVLDWTPDGRRVLFRSARLSQPPSFMRLFTISMDGGMPEPLPVPRGGLTSYSPDGRKIAYSPLQREFRNWKRYRGGRATYLAIYDLRANTYEEIARTKANDMFPMWHAKGIYFVSDREQVMNLYRYDPDTKAVTKLSDYREYDVKWPSLGPNAIVYENGGELYRWDLDRNRAEKLRIHVASELLEARPELKSAANLVQDGDLSPNAKRVLLSARGDVWTVPVEHGSARNLTRTAGVHEREAVWSPDAKWIAYFSDRSGEWDIYLQDQKGDEEVRITREGLAYPYRMIWSPDSKKLVFVDKHARLRWVDIDDRRVKTVVDSEYREAIGLGDWSPDSNWIAFTMNDAKENGALYLYSLEDDQLTQVTDHFFDDQTPVFDPDGKYLYFVSERHYYPSLDRRDWHWAYYHPDGVFALTLKADAPSPFAPRSDEEEIEEEEAEAEEAEDAEAEDDGEAEDAEEEEERTEIDLDGLGQRVVQIPLPPGTYGSLQAGSGKIYYLSIPFESMQAAREGGNGFTLHQFDMEEREDKVVMGGVTGYTLDKEGKKLLYRTAQGALGVVDAAPGQSAGDGSLSLSGLRTMVDPREEWAQLFEEAWRIERDFFWDPDMGGLDWDAIGERYRKLLPWVAHRSDLNYLIAELIAELSTSHTYVGGGDQPRAPRESVGLLGVDLEADRGYYRIAKIYPGESWEPDRRSPLTAPGLEVAEGDYLIAVNGVEIPSDENPFAYFQGLAGELVTLTVNDEPSAKDAREIMVEPIRNDLPLRYLDWVESNRQKVLEATDGHVGYMHVPDTAIDGLREFDKYLSAQLEKDGLIVDERFNAGGMIPDFFTAKLRRPVLNYLASREGVDEPWPPTALHGPKVMIANEYAGSGGDAFPWYFRLEGIGPIVGTTTWGGLVGISRRVPMLDGGAVTAPETGFWTPNNGGEWIAENKGIAPDYPVENRPDLVVQGQDPQLEKAIELILEALAQEPPAPERPRFPRQR